MKVVVDRICIRSVVTVFMFVGVALFLLPYFTESSSSGIIFLLVGAAIAVGCGGARCYLDGTCGEEKKVKR